MTNADYIIRRKEWKCYQITHAGEGERGQSTLVMSPYSIEPYEAARLAAEYFDDAEQLREHCSDGDFDGGQHVIEVVDEADQRFGRFFVRCAVKRQYTTSPV